MKTKKVTTVVIGIGELQPGDVVQTVTRNEGVFIMREVPVHSADFEVPEGWRPVAPREKITDREALWFRSAKGSSGSFYVRKDEDA